MVALASLYAAGLLVSGIGIFTARNGVFYAGLALSALAILCTVLAAVSPECADGSLTGAEFVRACS